MNILDRVQGAYTPTMEGGGTPATSTSVPITITPAAAPGAAAVLVRVMASTACFVAVGPNPTAAATDVLLAPNVPEFLYVPAGQKISALAQAAAGTINWNTLQ